MCERFVLLFGPHIHKQEASLHIVNEFISIKFIKYYFFTFFLTKSRCYTPRIQQTKDTSHQ